MKGTYKLRLRQRGDGTTRFILREIGHSREKEQEFEGNKLEIKDGHKLALFDGDNLVITVLSWVL